MDYSGFESRATGLLHSLLPWSHLTAHWSGDGPIETIRLYGEFKVLAHLK